VSIDRDDDAERKARVNGLLRQADELRRRARAAADKARKLIAHSEDLARQQDRRDQRDRLLKGVREGLRMAQPVILPFHERRRKKRA